MEKTIGSKANGADANTFGIPPLKFKTHKDPNPHGKPRVYFCCHPLDYHKFTDKTEYRGRQRAVICAAAENPGAAAYAGERA